MEVVWGDTSRHLPWSSVQAGSQTTFAHTRANHAVGTEAKRLLQEIAARDLGGSPGDYDTAMTDRTWSDPEGRQRHLDGIPFHREGDLRELGILAAYLASPASDYMTGQIIYMDGGLTAR